MKMEISKQKFASNKEFTSENSKPANENNATTKLIAEPIATHPALRARSKTSPDRHLSSSLISRRRFLSSNDQSNNPPLRIDIAPNTEKKSPQKLPPSLSESRRHTLDNPSAPIAIPKRKDIPQRPTTPLTARAPRGSFFPFKATPPSSTSTPEKSLVSSLPYVPPSLSPTRQNPLPTSSPVFQMTSPSAHPTYRPSSPLSPSRPIQIPPRPNDLQQKARRPIQNLSLNGLPKYHPGNFPQSSHNIPPSTSSARVIASQTRRHGSDAQQKLHQYQRDIIANATRSAPRSALSAGIKVAGLNVGPEQPRLEPLGSPGGLMTPLMLDGQGDYLLAGSGLSPSAMQDRRGREIVERLVRKENERRKYPEARSKSLSPVVSPAVSPAGGRG